MRLRSAAMNARNRVPLDIQACPELRDLAGKLSLFALTTIKQQIINAKLERARGRMTMVDRCDCHVQRRYGLPCLHMVPTDGTTIPLDSIAPFWRLDNWDQGLFFDNLVDSQSS